MEYAVEVEHLRHRYGKHRVYEDLNFRIPVGKVFGLLGKNGVGKTTLIKILMGFLRPTGGCCRILGDPSYALSPETRRRVGLLFEGHMAYEFMTIASVERFFAPFYPKWKREYYYSLTDKLRLPHSHRIANMSEGQRSQVVLGLIMAQQPDLMILDDYTMGLDAGYRRLFLEHLAEYLRETQCTVLVTSHIVQDLEMFMDEVIFLERGGMATQISKKRFLEGFRLYRMPCPENGPRLCRNDVIKNVEQSGDMLELYSFADVGEVAGRLRSEGIPCSALEQIPMTFEEAFIGFTGKY